MTQKLKKYFWLAVLAHLLLLLSFSVVLDFEDMQKFEKKSDRYLPAYLYQKETAAREPIKNPTQQTAQKNPEHELKNISPDKIALKKQEERPLPPQLSQKKSVTTPTFLEPESLKSGKPMDEPLLKELTRATAAKLFYPPRAAAFQLKGTVTISFMLYPDGRVTDVSLYKSSGFRILDEAALATIKAISPVRDANLYLKKPRFLLAGIIFG